MTVRQYESTEFPNLELLKYFCGREYSSVYDTRHCEGTAHYRADGGEEVVDRGTGLVVADGDRIQVIPEQE